MSDCKINIERGCKFCSCNCSSEDNIGAKSCSGCDKLASFDWLSEYGNAQQTDIFEIRFKNTRKGYYTNANNLSLKKGDIVAVEASPGHDIGIVSLTGDMVSLQMKKTGFRSDGVEFKKIYRKAKPYDIEKWQEAIALEHQTMIDTRNIANNLGLNMKIGDVEYQGDRLKAIFYYIADERVDFRELIKILADQFKIRVEMKQIGARQEAGRIGGIGSCGRELCCSAFISNFVSVTTNSARFQEILLNPQKLAGQCGKLKCCLNYEVDAYIDARKGFPKINEPLESIDGRYFLVKSDIFKKEMLFSTDPSVMANLVTLSTERVWEIIKQNRKGIKVDKLDIKEEVVDKSPDYKNVVGEESITRFDSSKQNARRTNTRRAGGTEHQGERSGDRRNRNNAPRPARSPQSAQKQATDSNNEAQQPKSTQERPQGGANRRNNNRRPSNRPRSDKPKTETEGK